MITRWTRVEKFMDSHRVGQKFAGELGAGTEKPRRDPTGI